MLRLRDAQCANKHRNILLQVCTTNLKRHLTVDSNAKVGKLTSCGVVRQKGEKAAMRIFEAVADSFDVLRCAQLHLAIQLMLNNIRYSCV